MHHSDPLKHPRLRSVVAFFSAPSAPEMPEAPEPAPLPPPPPVVVPEPPPPPPPPVPPPSTSKLEVQEAGDQQRRDQAKRRGMSKSLIAGETGGYSSSATGSGSLLG
jgi:hypothetical protein